MFVHFIWFCTVTVQLLALAGRSSVWQEFSVKYVSSLEKKPESVQQHVFLVHQFSCTSICLNRFIQNSIYFVIIISYYNFSHCISWSVEFSGLYIYIFVLNEISSILGSYLCCAMQTPFIMYPHWMTVWMAVLSSLLDDNARRCIKFLLQRCLFCSNDQLCQEVWSKDKKEMWGCYIDIAPIFQRHLSFCFIQLTVCWK